MFGSAGAVGSEAAYPGVMRYLVYVVPIGLAIYALIDLAQSRPGERAGLRPWLWAAIVVLLPVLGPVAWIATSRYLRAQDATPGGPPSRQRPMPRRRGPVAPDDDPEFLWRIERERRRREGGGGAPAADERAPDPEDPAPDARG